MKLGFVGLVEFSLQCFDVLAWPLLALVHPLCCTIRAIEANSISDSHKLNSYWVAFSLISLFEHTFMKLLEWLSVWPYIRLMIVFWLVIPHFDGAFYVYKHLICPCLSVDLQIVINWFNRRKESLFKKENFLAAAERYIEQNGPEALEKLVASKSGRTKSNSDVKEFKAVSSVENKEVFQAEPNVNWTRSSRFAIMDIKEKAVGFAADREILVTPPSKKVQESTWTISHVTQSDTTFNSHLDGKPVHEALKMKNEADPKLTEIDKSTFTAMETKQRAVGVATGREVLESSQEVQKEWTCALCQLTTKSEATLNSHLQGKKHKAAFEALKMKNEAEPKLTKIENSTFAAVDTKEKAVEVATGREVPESSQKVKKEWTCALCRLTTESEANLNSHLQGRKHKAACEALKMKNEAEPKLTKIENSTFAAVETKEKAVEVASGREVFESSKKVQKEWTCALCQLTTESEATLNSHLHGRKHKVACEALKMKNEAGPTLIQIENSTFAAEETKEKGVEVAASGEVLESSEKVQKEGTCALCRLTTESEATLNSHLQGRKHKAACEALKRKNEAEPKLTQIENSTFTAVDAKEKAVEVATDRETLESSKKVQKEWTCALCQLTTESEATLNSHLQGRSHKAACEALKMKNATEPKLTHIENSTFAAEETKDKGVEVATGGEVLESSKKVQKEWTCALCQLTTESEATLNFHLQGRKHKGACEALKAKSQPFVQKIAPSTVTQPHQPEGEPEKITTSSTSGQNLTIHENVQGQKIWIPASLTENSDISKEEPAEGAPSNGTKSNVSCNICNVHCNNVIVMASHLNGRKHQKKMRQREQNQVIHTTSDSSDSVGV